jgi:SAM-dependent methyltransferase
MMRQSSDLHLSHAAAKELFDRTADAYAKRAEGRTHDLSSFVFARRRETVLSLLDESGVEGTLLDFGMGPGVFAAHAVERGFHFVGIDISPEMIERAEALELPNTTYVCGDLEALESYRGAADAVLAIGLIDYLEDPDEGLRQLAACLRPGGVLIVSFRNRRSVNAVLRAGAKPVWRKLFGRSRWRAASAFVSAVHERTFAVDDVRNRLARLGLTDFLVRYHNANPFVFVNVPLGRRVWERWLAADRLVSPRVPRAFCDAGVLRARRTV